MAPRRESAGEGERARGRRLGDGVPRRWASGGRIDRHPTHPTTCENPTTERRSSSPPPLGRDGHVTCGPRELDLFTPRGSPLPSMHRTATGGATQRPLHQAASGCSGPHQRPRDSDVLCPNRWTATARGLGVRLIPTAWESQLASAQRSAYGATALRNDMVTYHAGRGANNRSRSAAADAAQP